MSDRIELRGLRVSAVCGVLPEEKAHRQSVDYGALCALVARTAEQESFDLLERFASRVAEDVLATGGVEAVTVVVRKLRPPVPEDLATSGVRIHRTA